MTTTPTLIAIHGHGDTPESALQWGRELVPRTWKVIAPEGPKDAQGDRSWFSTGPRGVDSRSLDSSIAVIARTVDESPGPVAVAGFSQGAALALHLTGRVQVAATVAFSGFLTDVEIPEAGSSAQAPILVVSSDGDEVIPGFLSSDAAATLRALGWSADHRSVPGGHRVGTSALALASDWLGEHLGAAQG